MLGTYLNIIGVVLGGLMGLAMRRPFSERLQLYLKVVLGVYTVWVGMKITFTSFGGSFWQIGKQALILMLAIVLGHLIGRLLRLQKGVNRLGQVAKQKLAAAKPDSPTRASDGFIAAAILYCAAPLAMLGPLQDGLAQNFQPLLIKAVMDGLIAMALVMTCGWPVILAAVPMAAFQVTVTRAAQWVEPMLLDRALVDPVNGICGLIMVSMALIIFEVRRVELADYLPCLAVAPLLAWLWR
ncbi:MAG: DUF554 family protein [Verrucomicrobia bacterium]|nr:DUF554 family protein [Verrucomicrobiota bacterium]